MCTSIVARIFVSLSFETRHFALYAVVLDMIELKFNGIYPIRELLRFDAEYSDEASIAPPR